MNITVNVPWRCAPHWPTSDQVSRRQTAGGIDRILASWRRWNILGQADRRCGDCVSCQIGISGSIPSSG